MNGRRCFAFWLLRFKALVLRDLSACHSLGDAYATGDHFGFPVPKDQRRALHWYSRAAEGGVSCSQYELGFMLLSGEGVDPNPSEGIRWMKFAGEQGYTEAIRLLADVYSSGAAGVAVDEQLANLWAKRLAEHLERFPQERREYECTAE
jgi:TPR repeat protein